MPSLFKYNSYHILGLDTSASQKDALKRSKEIINRLKIDDYPEYDIDTGLFKNLRTEELVKDAVQRLQNPKKRIKEYFFWFQLMDSVDEQAIGLFRKKDYLNAVRIWQNASDSDTSKAYFYKKNLAILYCLLLSAEDDKNYLRESLRTWKEIIDSDKFWKAFLKVYELHDDQATSQKTITGFKEHIENYLSDTYTELHQIHNNTDYINEFQKFFSAKGGKIEKSVLNPSFQTINDAVEKLEEMKVAEDGILDKQETDEIKKLIGSIQSELNNLIDIGFYNDSQTKVMRDRTAKALRSIVLDLHNNLSESEKAISLLNVAMEVVGTSSLKTKIKYDIGVIKEVQKNADLIKPINDLIIQEKFEQALELIELDREKHKQNRELQEFYNSQKKLCISTIALKKYKKARDYFDNKQEDSAKPLFKESGKLIYDNIDLFNFNKDAIDEIIEEIKLNITKLNFRNIEQFDEYRSSFVKLAKEKFEGQFEEATLIVLMDSYLFGGIAEIFKKIRHKASVVNALNTIGWLTVWFYGIGLIFFIAGWIYKNSDN